MNGLVLSILLSQHEQPAIHLLRVRPSLAPLDFARRPWLVCSIAPCRYCTVARQHGSISSRKHLVVGDGHAGYDWLISGNPGDGRWTMDGHAGYDWLAKCTVPAP